MESGYREGREKIVTLKDGFPLQGSQFTQVEGVFESLPTYYLSLFKSHKRWRENGDDDEELSLRRVREGS